jgi:hypothetical protein
MTEEEVFEQTAFMVENHPSLDYYRDAFGDHELSVFLSEIFQAYVQSDWEDMLSIARRGFQRLEEMESRYVHD